MILFVVIFLKEKKMWQPITNIPTDGTIVDLCLYNENEDLFYRIIDAFFDQESGWKYRYFPLVS